MISKLELEKPLIVLLLLAIVYTFFCMNLVSQFKALPSPIFGGDYYYQLGAITHMYNAPITEWTGSSNGIGSHPAYFIFYGASVTIFGKILGMEPMQAMFNFNFILPAISLLAFYFLFKKIFQDGWISLLATFSAVSLMVFPLFKYTEFTKYIVVPFFLYALYLFFTEQNRRNSILLGLMYGIMGISHSTAFVFASLSIAAIFACLFYQDKQNFKFSLDYFRSKQWFAIAFIIGFVIAQIYWFEPIFVYHGSTPLGSQLWSTEDFSSSAVQFSFLTTTLTEIFFNTGSLFALAMGLLALAGLFHLFKNLKSLKQNEQFILIIFLVAFALVFSYFITMPLLGTNFVPGYIYDLYLRTTLVMVSITGLLFAMSYLGQNGKYLILLMFILLLLSTFANYDGWYQGRFYFHPEKTLPEMYLSLQNHLKGANPHDSILTSNEIGFAINALTGNDVMVSRRAQNDPFVDFDQYQLDAAIILYGNNVELKKSLLKKYNVKYLYADANWVGMEWIVQNEQVVGYSDPLLLFYSPEKEAVLIKNGIKYVKLKGWVDPAVRGTNVKTYDLLVISPENYDWTGKGPWKDDIDVLLTDDWEYKIEGQLAAALFKVNN